MFNPKSCRPELILGNQFGNQESISGDLQHDFNQSQQAVS